MTQSTTVTHPVRPIPEGYHSVTPALLVRGGAQAIDFYTRAFGARELGRMPAPDGQRIWHAELQIGDARLMLADEFPDMGGHAPESLGGTPVCLHLYVEDADAAVQRAVDAGASVIQPLFSAPCRSYNASAMFQSLFWTPAAYTARSPAMLFPPMISIPR